MSRRGKYDNEFKVQALKLKKEVGLEEAATQLGINKETLKYWDRCVRNGTLRLKNSDVSPDGALTTKEEIKLLRERIRAIEKQNKRLAEENDFLREASAFFAASHPKLKRMRDSNSSQ